MEERGAREGLSAQNFLTPHIIVIERGGGRADVGGGKVSPVGRLRGKKEEGPSPPRSEGTVDWNNVAEGAGLFFLDGRLQEIRRRWTHPRTT